MGETQKSFGVYEILQTIGEGGGGTVYKAYHRSLQKYVVIKKIHDNINANERRTEVDVLKNLRHSYLPQVFDYFVVDGTGYTVMDFIEGESFQSLLDRGIRFKESQVIKYGKQLCEAVEYLHSQRIPVIHGDIKPDNIMLTPDDNICLIDFNISGIMQGSKAYTIGFSKGYAAPEQEAAYNEILRRREADRTDKTEILNAPQSVSRNEFKIPIDKRTDVYGIGATLFHLYTGTRLDQASDMVLSAKTSEGYLYILNKALQVNPANRYSSAGEMLKAFQNIHTKERKYRQLMAGQIVARLALGFLIAAGVGLAVYGFQQKKYDKADLYAEYTDTLSRFIEKGADEDDFEEVYNLAIELSPKDADAYLMKAEYLYSIGEYEEDIEFMDELTDNSSAYENMDWPRLYHLKGNAYYRLEDYEQARIAFENAIKKGADDGEIYVDYSISCAKLDRQDEAKIAFQKAEKYGADRANLLLVEGEIEYADGNYAEAEEKLRECIDIVEDDYRKLCAYVTCSKAILGDGNPTLEDMNRQIELLQKGTTDVSIGYRNKIYDILLDSYIRAYTICREYGESGADAKAEYAARIISLSDQLIEAGWANREIYSELLIVCTEMDDYENALKYAAKMEEAYPDDYVTYVREAYLEATIQGKKPEQERDYSAFLNCYNKVLELYEQSSGGKEDPDITRLNEIYWELNEKHWFDN